MKNEVARREIEFLDFYLQNHSDDYSEESHTAMMMAIEALEQKPYEKFKSAKDHICKLASDYKCWDNRLTQDEALELCHILEKQEHILDKIRDEIKALSPEPTAYDVVDGNPIKDAVWETIAEVLQIIDKYKAESEE